MLVTTDKINTVVIDTGPPGPHSGKKILRIANVEGGSGNYSVVWTPICDMTPEKRRKISCPIDYRDEHELDTTCDDDPHVPLLSVFAASNELPASRELDALADRLHFWHYVKPIAEPANFVRMLKLDVGEPDKVISLDDIKAAQEEVQKVQITDTIYEVFVNLSDQLRTADVPVTDRRFHQSIGVIQAEAWLNGREVAEVADMKPLMHMLWRTVEHIDKVRTIVLNLVDPLEKMVLDLQSELDKAVAEWDKTLLDTDVKAQRVQASLEMHDNFKKAKKEFLDLKAIEKENGRICKAMNSLEKTLKTIAIRIDEELGLS